MISEGEFGAGTQGSPFCIPISLLEGSCFCSVWPLLTVVVVYMCVCALSGNNRYFSFQMIIIADFSKSFLCYDYLEIRLT